MSREIDRYPVISAMRRDDKNTYEWLRTYANAGTADLEDAWQRPVRHNRKIERMALWNVLETGEHCMRIRDSERHLIRPALGDVETRYDLEASIRTVPELLPFTESERYKLRTMPDDPRGRNVELLRFHRAMGHEDGPYSIEHGPPELLDRWHQWLWVKGDLSVRGESPNPDAQVLSEGCYRLAGSLAILLEAA
jgi:hypothetical protein